MGPTDGSHLTHRDQCNQDDGAQAMSTVDTMYGGWKHLFIRVLSKIEIIVSTTMRKTGLGPVVNWSEP